MTEPIWVRPNIAAFAAGVQVKTIRAWAARGHISPANENGNFNLVEVYAYQREGTEVRLARAIAARKRRGETRRKAGVAPEVGGL